MAPEPELHTGESCCALRIGIVKTSCSVNSKDKVFDIKQSISIQSLDSKHDKFSSHLVLVAATDARGAITVVSIAFACNVIC